MGLVERARRSPVLKGMLCIIQSDSVYTAAQAHLRALFSSPLTEKTRLMLVFVAYFFFPGRYGLRCGIRLVLCSPDGMSWIGVCVPRPPNPSPIVFRILVLDTCVGWPLSAAHPRDLALLPLLPMCSLHGVLGGSSEICPNLNSSGGTCLRVRGSVLMVSSANFS